MSRRIQRRVEERAAGHCEYCGMSQALQAATFHIEHVIPASRGGKSTLGNLAWACPPCNLHKANRVEYPDPQSGELVRLYNPRVDYWAAHFEVQHDRAIGLTPTGRATIAALDLNHPRRIRIRAAERLLDLLPPELK